jgi:hypothetical protein
MERKKWGKMCPRYERPKQYIYRILYHEKKLREDSIYDMKWDDHNTLGTFSPFVFNF